MTVPELIADHEETDLAAHDKRYAIAGREKSESSQSRHSSVAFPGKRNAFALFGRGHTYVSEKVWHKLRIVTALM